MTVPRASSAGSIINDGATNHSRSWEATMADPPTSESVVASAGVPSPG